MKKILISLAVLLVIIIVVIFAGKNIIAKIAVTKGVETVTGLQMDIGSMNVGIQETNIGINNMRLHNPSGYPENIMMNMPEIFIDYDLGAFLKRKAHLEEIKINLKEFTVIKNKDGELNINSLNVAKEEKEPHEAEEKKKTEIEIDLLDLKIGKVAYKDFSKGDKPKVIEYDVNLHEQFHNITDLNEIGKIILVKALAKTNIAQLTGFALDSLQKEVLGFIGKAPIVGKPIEDIGEKAVDTLKKTTEGITKTLKLPSGK